MRGAFYLSTIKEKLQKNKDFSGIKCRCMVQYKLELYMLLLEERYYDFYDNVLYRVMEIIS